MCIDYTFHKNNNILVNQMKFLNCLLNSCRFTYMNTRCLRCINLYICLTLSNYTRISMSLNISHKFSYSDSIHLREHTV